MAWRVAESLSGLRRQVNETAPGRSRASDGAAGDPAHRSRDADHNPRVEDGSTGVVTALDLTRDPDDGRDAGRVARAIVDREDTRSRYVIRDSRIPNSSAIGGAPPWRWRACTGADTRTRHMRVSVRPDRRSLDRKDERRIQGRVTPRARPTVP